MFEFERLSVYEKAKKLNKSVTLFLENSLVDTITKSQLRRASFSVMLNIAEGSGRSTNRDKRNFLVISRGSVFECVAIFDYLKDINQIDASRRRTSTTRSNRKTGCIFDWKSPNIILQNSIPSSYKFRN